MSDEWQAKKHQEPSAPRPLVTRHSSHATLDYQWDAENRLKSVDNGNTEVFTYNGLGQQVVRYVTSESASFQELFDPAGQELGEYYAGGWWSWANVRAAGRVVTAYWWGIGGITEFTHPNALGSTSMVTDGSGHNNGNVMSITNNLAATRTETFTYDSLNRILTAGTSAWSQNFSSGIDRWSNLFNVTATGGAPTLSQTVVTSTNRLYAPCTSGTLCYDAAGNLTSDGLYTYSYDAEGHQTSAAGVTYVYDGDGRRVKKSNGTIYWYAGGIQPLYETNLTGGYLYDYIFFAGQRLARVTSGGGVYHYFGDALGSSRVIVPYGQNTACYDADFYAFGGEKNYVNTCTPVPANNYKFTGMERDAESGNDHTQFRQYIPNLGRWLSPDPLGGDITNPQSLNRYAYVLNNPTNLRDPLGLSCDDPTDGKPCVVTVHGGTPTPVPTADYPVCAANGSEGCIAFPCVVVESPNCTGPHSAAGQIGGSPGASGTAANNGIKQVICSAIPSGRTIGVSGGVGGVGSVGGGGELVVNYNSGQVSAFGFGGVQVGWNGGASGSVYTGFVYGLNTSNSNYSGGFTGFNAGNGPGGFVASSSGGLTGGPGRLVPNPRGVTAGGVSLGASLVPTPTGGVTATNYTSPTQLGKFWAFTPLDAILYAARQVCK